MRFAIFLCQLFILNQLIIAPCLAKILIQQTFVQFTLSEQFQTLDSGDGKSQQKIQEIEEKLEQQIKSLVESEWKSKKQQDTNEQTKQNTVSILNDDMSSKLDLFSNQRLIPSISQAPTDEEESIYTNKLSLFSSFGMQVDSKTIEYVKIKIRSNRKMIIQSNKVSQRSYELAENKFIIYTAEEFKNIFLTLREPNSTYLRNDPKNISVISPQNNLRVLQVVDINWKAQNKMSPVKFQQGCGACYSFTSIGTIESVYMIQQNQSVNLAQQQLVDCSSAYGNYGCIGGWTINAYKYVRDIGVVFESDYPFAGEQGKCTIPQEKQKYKIKDYVELKNDCNQVIAALQHHPLSIAINADGWQYYSSGLYTDCGQGPSNHGVILAGVDSKSWLIKNSWGSTWGEEGYIRIDRTAQNQACNVCKWASYPLI